jgi:hypothetical protein
MSGQAKVRNKLFAEKSEDFLSSYLREQISSLSPSTLTVYFLIQVYFEPVFHQELQLVFTKLMNFEMEIRRFILAKVIFLTLFHFFHLLYVE